MSSLDSMKTRLEFLEKRLDKYEAEQKEIKDILIEIHKDLARYKGVFGAVLLVFSAIGAVITLVLQYRAGN